MSTSVLRNCSYLVIKPSSGRIRAGLLLIRLSRFLQEARNRLPGYGQSRRTELVAKKVESRVRSCR